MSELFAQTYSHFEEKSVSSKFSYDFLSVLVPTLQMITFRSEDFSLYII